MNAGFSENIVDIVELALDWRIPVSEEMLQEYERVIAKRQQFEKGQQDREETMEKERILILTQYADAVARIKYLRRGIAKLENKMSRMLNTDYGIASDTVTKGKRGKKPLGTVKVTGFRCKEYTDAENSVLQKKLILKQREEELLELQNQVEDFIESVNDIEMRNILSLYYIDDLTWNQVALQMNDLYKKKSYTESGCRNKHNRFIEKNL